ncbi:hypothetical protein HDU79_009701 [Rhizoclosmatium sp. JEL0117]|nr:hypothetical protein HDU79_009701 [Rhizoclosmatium sp. JEL0117]
MIQVILPTAETVSELYYEGIDSVYRAENGKLRVVSKNEATSWADKKEILIAFDQDKQVVAGVTHCSIKEQESLAGFLQFSQFFQNPVTVGEFSKNLFKAQASLPYYGIQARSLCVPGVDSVSYVGSLAVSKEYRSSGVYQSIQLGVIEQIWRPKAMQILRSVGRFSFVFGVVDTVEGNKKALSHMKFLFSVGKKFGQELGWGNLDRALVAHWKKESEVAGIDYIQFYLVVIDKSHFSNFQTVEPTAKL